MSDIMNLKVGLPTSKMTEIPLLQQFNLSRAGENHTGTLLFADGSIYITVGENGISNIKWIYFTHIKKKGQELIENLLREDFSKLDSEDLSIITAENYLHWKSFLDEKHKDVKVASGSYSNIPPVFGEIEQVINRYMFKMNEKVGDE